jgi:hypothetical protein
LREDPDAHVIFHRARRALTPPVTVETSNAFDKKGRLI